MTTERSLLMIADIGGYTDYMRTHRMSLAHAEVNTTRLLEKVIDAAPEFELIEVEGDAAFLSRQADGLTVDAAVSSTLEVATAMHRAFHVERQYVATNLCPCGGARRPTTSSSSSSRTSARSPPRRSGSGASWSGSTSSSSTACSRTPSTSLSTCCSPKSCTSSSGALPGPGQEVPQDLEGIGPARAYFMDVADLPGSPAPAGAIPAPRIGKTSAVAGSGLPCMLGLRRRPCTASAFEVAGWLPDRLLQIVAVGDSRAALTRPLREPTACEAALQHEAVDCPTEPHRVVSGVYLVGHDGPAVPTARRLESKRGHSSSMGQA